MTDKPLRLINGLWMYNPKGWPEKPNTKGCMSAGECGCYRMVKCACMDYQRDLQTAIEEAIPVEGEHLSLTSMIVTHTEEIIKFEGYPIPEGYTINIEIQTLNQTEVISRTNHTMTSDTKTVARLIPVEQQETNRELKEAVAGQETLALDLCRCMDLLNRCHSEWMDCINELELFRTEHPPLKISPSPEK